MQVIIGDLPVVDGARPFNANGSLHFGPDGFLYLTLGDYDKPLELGPLGQPLPQDLASPIGKVLRVNKADGSGPADNPFVDQDGADSRIFAYGFREPFDFAFHPESGRMYGSDNGGRTCEELNIIEGGADYGWPRTGQSPFDCAANPQRSPVYMLSREGTRPNDIDSTVGISAIDFVSGAVYPVLGDSLVLCEIGTQFMRRLVLAPPNFDSVTANDIVQRDCWTEVAVNPDGIIYYSNNYEVRRLLPPPETTSPEPTGG
jgi:glucose/arabinose dehydrogenase